jgi:hypothetical protein
MRIEWLLCCVALVGCGAPANPGSEHDVGRGPVNTALAAPPPQAEAASATASPNPDMDRYFPLSRYRGFPAEARSLLQRADFESDHCRGSTPRDPDVYRACNRAWEAMVALERLGWCWGSEKRLPVMRTFIG